MAVALEALERGNLNKQTFVVTFPPLLKVGQRTTSQQTAQSQEEPANTHAFFTSPRSSRGFSALRRSEPGSNPQETRGKVVELASDTQPSKVLLALRAGLWLRKAAAGVNASFHAQ
jgi:hypothetical protein